MSLVLANSWCRRNRAKELREPFPLARHWHVLEASAINFLGRINFRALFSSFTQIFYTPIFLFACCLKSPRIWDD